MHKGKFVPLTPYLLCSAARLRDDVVIFAAQHVMRELFAGSFSGGREIALGEIPHQLIDA